MKNNRKIGINVILLGIASFLTDVSSEIIFPILPMFIVSLGGNGVIIGLIGGIMECVSSIFKVFSGYLSDRTGKRLIFVFSGYAISSISKIILPFSTVWQHAVAIISIERIGKGIRTAPRDAIIAESSNGQTGKGFGIHRAMDTAGAVVGSAFSFIMFYFLGFKFEAIILSAGIIGFLALFPLFFVKEKYNTTKASFGIKIKAMPKNFKIFLVVAGIFALGNFTYMFFILKTQIALSSSFNLFMAIALPILLYVLFNVIYALFSIPAGVLSDKFGRPKILAAGYILFSITCISFTFSDSLFLFVILFALYGITYALIDGNQRAYASDLVPENLKGTGLGAFHTVIGLTALPSGIIAGLLWEFNFFGLNATFLYGSILGISAAILLLITQKLMHRMK